MPPTAQKAKRRPGPIPRDRKTRDAAIAQDRRAGMDRPALAAKYGLSVNTIGRILWEQGR